MELQVHRNDQITLDRIKDLNPERILVSPGPCSPKEAGLSNDIIAEFGKSIPTFGVCLGHQCIGNTFGAVVKVNYRLMHGKTSPIRHNGKDVFADMPNPFDATRYHSLVVEKESLPDCLEVTAETDEGEIMGLQHKTLADLGRPVPSRKHPHPGRPHHHAELPEARPLRSARARSVLFDLLTQGL